jgi:hypothetical protein
MIKFGWRYSLLYPSLFIITLGARSIVTELIKRLYHEKSFSFINLFLIYVVQIIMCAILSWNNNRKNKSKKKSQFLGIALNEDTKKLDRPDSNLKIIILLIFSAFFECIGALIRKLASDSVLNFDYYYANYRSSEIIIASVLCYFALNTKIYRHHLFSLIIMLIYLIIAIIYEVYLIFLNGKNYRYLLITLFSGMIRVFLDATEKYLFNTDFIDLYKMMFFEGIINTLNSAICFCFDSPKIELSNFILFYDENKLKFVGVIFLLIVYSIVTGFKNIYRRETIKEFSPMTRILAQSILDPVYIIYEAIQDKKKGKEIDTNNIFILVFSIIMIFCSCIYNEIFVLYFCGLERDTHLAVAPTSENYELQYSDTSKSLIDSE